MGERKEGRRAIIDESNQLVSTFFCDNSQGKGMGVPLLYRLVNLPSAHFGGLSLYGQEMNLG